MAKPQPFCSLCGQSMPFSQLPAHRQEAHPEVMEILAKSRRDYFRRHQEVFLPALLAWGLLFVLGFYQGFLRGWPFIPYAIGGSVAILLLPYLNTRPAVRERRRALSGIVVPCVFCGASITLGTPGDHEKLRHPEASRYARLWRQVPLGLVLGYVAGALLLWLAFELGYLSSEVTVVGIFVLVVPVLVAAVWFRNTMTRRVIALRDREWRASHGGAAFEGLLQPPTP